ncbi:hypothetical protein FACS1894193_08700 [Bacilli bacterium]|nr:hypothetical protein FACS1894193_08700 [Bacilli bacterium]GHU46042.1 hypothetical protein FACS1894194_3030 [Bacilli bacterium]
MKAFKENTKQTNYRSWKSGKKWCYAASLLSLSLALGAEVLTSIRPVIAVTKNGASSRAAMNKALVPGKLDHDTGNRDIKDADFSDAKNWDAQNTAKIELPSLASLTDGVQSSKPGALVYRNQVDLSKPFTFSTEMDFGTDYQWVESRGFVFTPAKAADFAPDNGGNWDGLGIAGQANTVFVGRDCYQSGESSNQYGKGKGENDTILIRKTDYDGNLESFDAGNLNVPYPDSTLERLGAEETKVEWQPVTAKGHKTEGILTYTVTKKATGASLIMKRELTMPNYTTFGMLGMTSNATARMAVALDKNQGVASKTTAPVRVKYLDDKGNPLLDGTGNPLAESLITASVGEIVGLDAKADAQYTAPAFQGYHIVQADSVVAGVKPVGAGLPITAFSASAPFFQATNPILPQAAPLQPQPRRTEWGGTIYKTYVYRSKITGTWACGNEATRKVEIDATSGYGGKAGYKTLQIALIDARTSIEKFQKGGVYSSQSQATKDKIGKLLVKIQNSLGRPDTYASSYYISAIFDWFTLEEEIDDLINAPVMIENVLAITYAKDAQRLMIKETSGAKTIRETPEDGLSNDMFDKTYTAPTGFSYDDKAILASLPAGFTATFNTDLTEVHITGSYDDTTNGANPAERDASVQTITLAMIGFIQEATITYQDVTTGQTIKTDKIDGTSDTLMLYDTSSNLPKGYVVKSNHFKDGAEKFDNDSSVDQTYLVELVRDSAEQVETKTITHEVTYTVKYGLVSAPKDYATKAKITHTYFVDQTNGQKITTGFTAYALNGVIADNPTAPKYASDHPNATVTSDGQMTFKAAVVPSIKDYVSKITANTSIHYNTAKDGEILTTSVLYQLDEVINVTLPVDTIFYNQTTDTKIKAPNYKITNNSGAPVKVSLADFKAGTNNPAMPADFDLSLAVKGSKVATSNAKLVDKGAVQVPTNELVTLANCLDQYTNTDHAVTNGKTTNNLATFTYNGSATTSDTRKLGYTLSLKFDGIQF